jgi:putrescine aminotransferase
VTKPDTLNLRDTPETPDILSTAAREKILNRYKRHVNRGFAGLASVLGLPIGGRSSGCFVFDEQDQAYLDCGGYGVFLHGHRHPLVVEAVKAQLDRHPLATHGLINAELAWAAERLASVTPPGLDYITFTNSGAEAAELAIKLARLNGKPRLIAMTGGFHGKTMGALSINGKAFYKEPFKPLLPDVYFVAFGDAGGLEEVLAGANNSACVIVEPVQGEAGVNIPPAGYLKRVEDLCRHHNALLVLDEIQTGLGRLGAWWGADREGVVPDILLAGKGLSGGVVAVGAVAAKAETFEPLNRDPFLHSSTFGGNPLAMAAARAAIDAIEREGLVDRAARLGEILLRDLRTILQSTCGDFVVEVRGLGLMLGVEFISEAMAGDFVLRLLAERVVVSHSLNAHRVVRVTPPAILAEAECEILLRAVGKAAAGLREAW